MSLLEIPELRSLRGRGGVIRIPPGVDVPVTDRVVRLIDTAPFRRLTRISQLGLVGLVYPAANHTRHEHSLGVYLAALECLQSLAADPRFSQAVDEAGAELLIVAALLHDVGHWPYCHPIEDIRLPNTPDHEVLASEFLRGGEIADALRRDWSVEPDDVVALLAGESKGARGRLLDSLLSGPIDVDKIDYLARDSLHAGVPYGQQFDRPRLVRSLCLNRAGDGIAITEKGKTAAEMMVFARYVMFSEVYWHHTVRAATAMLQRAYYDLHEQLPLDEIFRSEEEAFRRTLIAAAVGRPAHRVLTDLFGPERRVYKRLTQCSVVENVELYRRLARKPYPWLVACAAETAAALGAAIGEPVTATDVLFDAPPMKLEVEFDIDVCFEREGVYRRLGEISPMVRALAREQFDDHVKRVRVFVHPRVAKSARAVGDLNALINAAIDRAESGA